MPAIEGIDHAKVLPYPEAILHPERVGERVVIIGAGGIGFDTASALLHSEMDQDQFLAYWGVDKEIRTPGGLEEPTSLTHRRQVTVLKRSPGKAGKDLGKTTGWIHRAALKKDGVTFLSGCSYERIDDAGVHVSRNGQSEVVAADTVVICAGQLSVNELHSTLKNQGVRTHLIGGAFEAKGIDAKRAIEQAYRLAVEV